MHLTNSVLEVEMSEQDEKITALFHGVEFPTECVELGCDFLSKSDSSGDCYECLVGNPTACKVAKNKFWAQAEE